MRLRPLRGLDDCLGFGSRLGFFCGGGGEATRESTFDPCCGGGEFTRESTFGPLCFLGGGAPCSFSLAVFCAGRFVVLFI